eukprot:70272_1
MDNSFRPPIQLQRSHKNLQLWIQANHVLNDTLPNQITQSIIDVFGTNFDIIKLLLRTATNQQLTSIINIINQHNVKMKDDNGRTIEQHLQVDEYQDHDTPQEHEQMPLFDIISNQSIQHLSLFLAPHEVVQFKNVSRRMSIICLQEMQKITIHVCNTSNLLQTYRGSYFDFSKHLTAIRYVKRTEPVAIAQALHEEFKVPPKHQLLFKINEVWARGRIHQTESLSPVNKRFIADGMMLVLFNKKEILSDTSIDNVYVSDNLYVLKQSNAGHKSQDFWMKYLILQNINENQMRQYIQKIVPTKDTVLSVDINKNKQKHCINSIGFQLAYGIKRNVHQNETKLGGFHVSRLYRFAEDRRGHRMWKTRATNSEIEFFENNGNGRVRLLCYENKVCKLRANHLISSSECLNLIRRSETEISWVGMDILGDEYGSDVESVLTVFTAKLTNKKNTDEAMNTFQNIVQKIEKSAL